MALPFAGKVCLITGGAKGIGLACARAMGLKGAKVRCGLLRLALAALHSQPCTRSSKDMTRHAR